MQILRSISNCICKIFEFMGGCLGCCTKSPLVTTDTKQTGSLGKGQNNSNKHSILEDFWSSSTYDMDISVPQSQISASSTSNAPADAHSSSGTNPSEFVNRGFLLWNQTRQQWVGDKAPDNNKKSRQPVIRKQNNIQIK
ncbi:uncharacterized protein [Rutidosis leptorrhynchoides]|uniref:uncharacterized protein isoform X2 n=1 Tax=Rutidosis leptorrhynchoides TaxID=125765 RepID=UPI003A993B38